MTRLVCWLVLLFKVGSAGAQNWDRVAQLPAETRIRVDAAGHGVSCIFVSADDADLICERRTHILFFPIDHRLVFRKDDVRRVRLSHQVRSGFAGAGIGVAVGVGLAEGALLGSGEKDHSEDAVLVLPVAALLGTLGAQIGAGLDFLAGPVVYQR